MFKSKQRALVVPQHEHGRMAGTIASLWGNADFARPVLDFEAFLMGVALHDWGYGMLDNLPIRETPEEEWLQVTRQGFEHTFDHPVTDVIVKMHLRRLLGFKQTAQRTAAAVDLDKHIQGRLAESACSLADFEWADRITNLCDFIAFYFAFEEPIDRTFKVFSSHPSNQEIEIRVVSSLNGDIRISPWPFSVEQYPGFIFGYALEGYPRELKPVMMPYRLINAG